MKDYHINIFYNENYGGYVADIPPPEPFAPAAGEADD